MKEPITIVQRIVAAVIADQAGISSTDRALKLYVQGREIHPSWDEVGETLLRSLASAPPGSLPRVRGLKIVRRRDPRK